MDPFDQYIDPTGRGGATAGGGASGSTSKGLQYWKQARFQRINTACRVLTFVFALAAVFAIIFANDSYEGFTIRYKYFTSFKYVR